MKQEKYVPSFELQYVVESSEVGVADSDVRRRSPLSLVVEVWNSGGGGQPSDTLYPRARKGFRKP